MSNLTPDDVDLRLTATKAELSEEDQRLWLGLEDEKISRIAGDEANKQFTELVKQQNSGTESRLSTEVIHRSEGDVSNLNSLNAVAKALSDYRIKTDLEINNEVIARKSLGVDLNSRIDTFMASWDHNKFLIYRTIQEVQDDVDGKYVSMDTRITKYEQMLSDITSDSIQITMDNGEINMGAWTILSQAREWDLQIIGRMKDFQIKTEEDLNQALEDIQNSLPVEQDIVDRAIEALSNAPIIKELDEKIAGSIADIDTVHKDLLTEITTRQNEMVAQAQNTADELKKQSDALNATITAEANARIDAIEREATIRADQLNQEALERTAEIDEKLQDLNVIIDADLVAVNGRIDATNDTIAELNQNLDRDVAAINDRVDAVNAKADAIKVDSDQKILDLNTKADGIHDDVSAETAARIAAVTALNDGLTSEIQHRKDGDQVITTALENYKSSNDTALANVRTEIAANVTATTANATKIDALDVRLTTNEEETGEAKALAATATQKADTALTETSALASQMTTVNASIDGIKGDLANKADAAAFNQLKAEVVEIDGKVLTNTQDLTALKTTVTGLDGKVTGNTSAISELTTQQVVQGDQITQLTSDTTALKNSLEAVEDDLATKVDSTAFNELSTKVNKNAGDITVQAGSITKLQSDLALTNQAVATKANATALNALDTKVTQQGNTITSQGGAITQLQNDVSSIDTELDSKASSAALSALDTKVTQQGGVLTSQGTAITKLENDLSTVNTELDTKADSAALNALDSKVTTIDGKVTSQGTSLTSLTNRVTKNEGDISKKAESSVVSSLSSKVDVMDGKVTSQGTSITKLTNDLATTNGKVDTKADATALTALDNKVTSVDGKVTTNSTAITTLTGRVTTAENNINKKLDASVIQSYYTKVETDQAVSGAINRYDASLVIGGKNLFSYTDWNASATTTSYSTIVPLAPIQLLPNTKYTISTNINKTAGNFDVFAMGVGVAPSSATNGLALNEPRTFTTNSTGIINVGMRSNTLNSTYNKWIQIERGDTATQFTPSEKDLASDLRVDIGANATAITNTNAEVSRIDGTVNSQSIQLTELTASVDTNTRDIATKASAQAVADLSTRVATTENAVTVQSQDLVRLQNELDVTNAAVSQKADSSALTALTTEVTNINNKVTVNSDAITSLSGRVTTVEQGLTTKLNASVINAYSTTVDMNNAIASSITTYDANLVIGGSNLFANSDFSSGTSGWESAGVGAALSIVNDTEGKFKKVAQVVSPSTSQGFKSINTSAAALKLVPGDTYTMSGWVRSSVPMTLYPAIDGSGISNALPVQADTAWKYFTITKKLTSNTVPRIYGRGEYFVANLKLEKGTKATDWTPSNSEVQNSINANATAIQSTNASVTTLDGRITSNSSAITSLNNRMTVAEGNISQKADASALSTLDTKVTTIDGKVTTQGAAITKLQNDLVITDQKVETKADANALSTLSNKVEGIDGRVTANSSALNSLTNRVTSVEGVVTKKADSTAVNALTSRVETAEGQISSQGSAVTKLQNDLVITANTANAALPQITTAGAYKAFRNVLNYYIASSAIPVTTNLVISTPITFTSKMTNISIKGYMYKGANTTIDLRVGFYAYNSTSFFLQTSVTNNGSFPFKVRLAVKDGKVAIILSSITPTTMAYPQFVVDAEFGYTLAPDTWKDGWSCAVVTEAGLDAYGVTNITTPPMFDPKTEITANATAIQTLDNKVTQNGKDITSISTAQTALANRVSTVETGLTNKADSSAVQQLDSRVVVTEGKTTSNSTAITNLQNTVNHATTGLSTKASSAALTAVDNKVIAVDGRVTTTNSNVSTLSGRVSTVENGLASKADVSALNNIYTKAEADAKATSLAAGEVSKYDAKLAVGGKNLFSFSNWKNNQITPQPTFTTVPVAPIELLPNTTYTISTNYPARGGNAFDIFVTTTQVAASSTVNGVALDMPRTFTTNDTGTAYIHYRDVNLNPGSPHWIQIERGSSATGYVPNQTDTYSILNHETAANATAIQSTNSEVSRINGVVSGHTTQLSNLTASIAGKADTTALNALTVRVANEESKSSSQATSITNLNSSVADALKAVTISDTRSTNQPPSWYLANYPRRVVNEFKTQTAIGVGGFFGGTYCNLETKVYYSDLSGGDIIQTATSSVDPSLYVQRRSNGVSAWTAWVQPIKDLRDTLGTKASASALSTLDTKVADIDGKVTTQASSILQLQTDVSGNSSKLIVQGEVVDGLKASYVVKTDVNGLVAGYGLYNTGSSSAFGVNADFFYVGKGTTAANGKKPFMVLTTPTTIGGVTYPAGTWIDVALIANATIGTAHIADASITNAKIKDLDASKITTGVLNANRVRVGPTSSFDDGYNPATKARTFVAQPTVPYSVGDIWKNGTSTYICKTQRVAGSFTASEWDKVGDVTSENTAANANQLGGTPAATINTNIANADTKAGQAQTLASNADAKATTAQSTANTANNQVNAWKFTGTTNIDGGNIQADTVTAAQISVNDLSAISANLGTIKVGSANIADLAVDTLKIQDNAVTVPSTSYVAGNIEVATNSWVTVASLFVEALEGTSLIVFNTAYNVSANGSVGVGCRILRDTTVVRDEFQIIAASLVGGNSIRPSGSVSTTYLETGKQNATIHVQMRSNTGTNINFSHRSLTSLVVKK